MVQYFILSNLRICIIAICGAIFLVNKDREYKRKNSSVLREKKKERERKGKKR